MCVCVFVCLVGLDILVWQLFVPSLTVAAPRSLEDVGETCSMVVFGRVPLEEELDKLKALASAGSFLEECLVATNMDAVKELKGAEIFEAEIAKLPNLVNARMEKLQGRIEKIQQMHSLQAVDSD